MSDSLWILLAAAASIGVVHTALGPDHYVPFIALSRARGWSVRKTVAITLLCGLGHVLSSVILGVLGIGLGVALFRLENVESVRAALAAWLMLAFGLAYFAWGVRRAYAAHQHSHAHQHADGTVHMHEHDHRSEHAHPHDAGARRSLTAWALFTIFVFGPCEPLIPLLMYPAASGTVWQIVAVTAVFGAATLVTMTAVVLASLRLAERLPGVGLGAYGHATAGLVILACGIAMRAGL